MATKRPVRPRREETPTALAAPEAGATELDGEGPDELLETALAMFAQAIRPEELLWMTMERLPRNAPMPDFVEM